VSQSALQKIASLLLKADKRLTKHQFPKLRQATIAEEICSTEAVFFITPGRSGTKSITQYCEKYTNIYCEHAATPWLASTGYAYHQDRISGESARQAYYSCREQYLLKAYESKRTFLDGDCKNLPLLPELAKLLPNAKFIHVVRQPESFILSGLARGYYSNFPEELWGHLAPTAPLETELNQTEKIAYFWNEANVIAEKMKQELGTARVATLISEHVFARPSLIFDALDQLSVTYNKSEQARYTIEHLNKQNANPQYKADNSEILSAIKQHCPTRLEYYPGPKLESHAK
jgi:Sulfotransferase family